MLLTGDGPAPGESWILECRLATRPSRSFTCLGVPKLYLRQGVLRHTDVRGDVRETGGLPGVGLAGRLVPFLAEAPERPV